MSEKRPRKILMIMINDMPSFWKAGDKRRIRAEFADALLRTGWAKLADSGEAKPEEASK